MYLSKRAVFLWRQCFCGRIWHLHARQVCLPYPPSVRYEDSSNRYFRFNAYHARLWTSSNRLFRLCMSTSRTRTPTMSVHRLTVPCTLWYQALMKSHPFDFCMSTLLSNQIYRRNIDGRWMIWPVLILWGQPSTIVYCLLGFVAVKTHDEVAWATNWLSDCRKRPRFCEENERVRGEHLRTQC